MLDASCQSIVNCTGTATFINSRQSLIVCKLWFLSELLREQREDLFLEAHYSECILHVDTEKIHFPLLFTLLPCRIFFCDTSLFAGSRPLLGDNQAATSLPHSYLLSYYYSSYPLWMLLSSLLLFHQNQNQMLCFLPMHNGRNTLFTEKICISSSTGYLLQCCSLYSEFIL